MVNEQNGKIGVVTVTYNSGEVIDDFMTSMLAQDYQNYILYIVDNASSDSTLTKIEKYKDDRIVIIANEDNLGVATGNNQGTKASIASLCSHVLLINNDTTFSADLLSQMLQAMIENNQKIVTPKIMFFDRPNVIWYGGGGFVKYNSVHYNLNKIDANQDKHPIPVEYASTCCLLVDVDIFSQVGFMDDRYFVYYDDTDFCMRCKKSGNEILYCPKIFIYHKVSSLTQGKDSDFTRYYQTRNKIYFLSKHASLVFLILNVLLTESRIVILLIVRRNISEFQIKQKALIDGILMSLRKEDMYN
jgi:GT2 family glycosyltransferase